MALSSILEAKVSWFKDYNSPHPAGETTLVRWLTGSKLKEQVLAIRNTPNKKIADAMKAELPAITPSGTFSYRKDGDLITHSGFICIDIDLKGNERIRNYDQLKEQLSHIKQVAYCGLSVSGNGYFALIPIAYPEKHLKHFLALQAVFAKLGIRIDEKCKNLSRLRGYSWDPDAFFNHQAEPFTGLLEPAIRQPRPVLFQKPSFQPTKAFLGSDAERVEALLQKIEAAALDLTEDYNYWFAIACNFAATFGEAGRDYFHRVSCFYPDYNPGTCDHKYNEAIKKMAGATANLGAFVNRCKAAGIGYVVDCQAPKPPQKALAAPPKDYITVPPNAIPQVEIAGAKPMHKSNKTQNPVPIPTEIPYYIMELEEKLKKLTRPIPQLILYPSIKIIDPESFITSHLSTLKNNHKNLSFSAFYSRLFDFYQKLV